MIIRTERTEADVWHDLIMLHQRVVFPHEHVREKPAPLLLKAQSMLLPLLLIVC